LGERAEPAESFLWAGDNLGAEGFVQGHNFTIWNNVVGFVFSGKSIDENAVHGYPLDL